MDIEEFERRLALMCKLAEYNKKIREDYDKGISAVLDGTQKVIDFITKNAEPEPNSVLKDIAIGAISSAIPNEMKLIDKGISAMLDLKMPNEPINPIINQIKVEQESSALDVASTILKDVFVKLSELRNAVNESDISLNSKYSLEKTIYDLQKLIWENIKSR
jgi:hypothetical protein